VFSERSMLITSESVSEAHPDKLCDRISDAILDSALAEDKYSRVACETLVKTGFVIVAGELTTNAHIDYEKVIRDTIKAVGYDKSEYGFHYDECAVLVAIGKQSPDIAMGVDRGGAGDQGMMFGYATTETPEYMPMPIMLAHKILLKLRELRISKKIPYLRPDAKSQVTVRYEGGIPKSIEAVVLSTQHSEEVNMNTLREQMIEEVIKPIIPEGMLGENIKYYINPTGRFVIGGPKGDSGLTGRKIMVDTYGGLAHHGGGAFSGKDPTKVDRSAAYTARYIAKNIVASGLAKRCEIQLAYAIGIEEPVSIMVNTFGTAIVEEEKIEKAIREIFPIKPLSIIEELDLRRPIYQKTSAYGHFGREDKDFTWEKLDKVDTLKDWFSLR